MFATFGACALGEDTTIVGTSRLSASSQDIVDIPALGIFTSF